MNKITKLILRLLKENDIYKSYINNKNFILQLNNVTIPWIDDNPSCFCQELYDLLNNKINIKDYKNYANFKSNIIIYNIKDVEKLFNYFNNNGIIWGGGRKCTINSIPNGFNPYDKSSYLKLYDDEGRIYYGRNYNLNYSYSETTLTEDDFYVFYEKHKKKINDNFERFLIK